MKKLMVLSILLMSIVIVFSGCLGNSDDRDGDGYGNEVDEFPDDSSEWIDTDGDGVGDNGDDFPEDYNEQYDTDNDGVGDNVDAFDDDATQQHDRDGDGYGDNENGSNPDIFPDDESEWFDKDGDGIGDNRDINDNGNAGIEIIVNEYIGSGQSDTNEDGGKLDPMFAVFGEAGNDSAHISTYFDNGYWTDAFIDQEVIYNPLMYQVDIPDDTCYLKVGIYVEDGRFLGGEYVIDETIDVSSDSDFTHSEEILTLCPNSGTYFLFDDDGQFDYKPNELNGYIEWEVEIITIE